MRPFLFGGMFRNPVKFSVLVSELDFFNTDFTEKNTDDTE
jgi:hypothetical protein